MSHHSTSLLIASSLTSRNQGHPILLRRYYRLGLPTDLHVLLFRLPDCLSVVPESYSNYLDPDLDVGAGRVHPIP